MLVLQDYSSDIDVEIEEWAAPATPSRIESRSFTHGMASCSHSYLSAPPELAVSELGFVPEIDMLGNFERLVARSFPYADPARESLLRWAFFGVDVRPVGVRAAFCVSGGVGRRATCITCTPRSLMLDPMHDSDINMWAPCNGASMRSVAP